MDSGMMMLLEKGGPWSQTLFFGSFVWAMAVLLLIVVQRRRLEVQHADLVGTAGDESGPEDLVDRVRVSLDAISGGAVGLAAVAAWWLLALAALIWTASATIDILRLGDEAYVTDLVAGA
ncbi:hypothetical protein GF314_13765, partial [bacterium]|nr:hypothetical protein [bacterium]